MNLREYLALRRSPDSLLDFMDFSTSLKSNFKTLDGYAFDFNSSINSVKLYYKTYNRERIFDSVFFKWFSKNGSLGRKLKQDYTTPKKKVNGLSGLNFAIKYNFESKQLTKSIYFSDNKNSSLVIQESNNNILYNKYYYIYNELLIKLINKSFHLKMPPHKEGIELSFRGKAVHCTVFPKINHKKFDIKQSEIYCQRISRELLIGDPHTGQDSAIDIHSNTNNSSLITKGYTSKDKFKKIYFGCFDWEKSSFHK